MTISEFFKTVVDGRVELRAIVEGKGAVGRHFGDDFDQFIQDHQGKAHIYFGVLPRPIPDTAGVLWADIDYKMIPEPEAREKLKNFEPQPHIVVASGGGLHAYWLVDPPIPTSELKGTLKALARELGADPASTDAARILRVPDTWNIKYDPPRMCQIERVADCLFPYHIRNFNLGEIVHEPEEKYEAPLNHKASKSSLKKAKDFAAVYPPAIQGQHGDEHTFILCTYLVKNFGLSFAQALELLIPWNKTCKPVWDVSEIKEKLGNAVRYGKNQIGTEDPEKDFSKVADEEPEPPDASSLGKLDAKYHVVDSNGQTRVFYEDPHGDLGPCWKSYDTRNFVDVMTYVHNVPVVQMKGRGNVSLAKLWLENNRTNKKQYTGIAFDPSNQVPKHVFNVWTGLGVKPEPGNWDLVNELIFDVLSNKSEESYNYIMDWCAMSVQKPWIKPGTTIIFSGDQGTGKSAFGKMFTYLFGRHGMRLDDSNQVTGRFNDHLSDKVGIFVDEAFWTRNHQAEAVLKGLITDETKQYEAKFQGLRIGRSYLHVMMASNNEYVANVTGSDERRYAVFEPGPKKSFEFYAKLIGNDYTPNWVALMPAWLDALMKRDISKFNPSADRPKTAAYEMQRIISMDPIKTWIWEFVENDCNDPNGLMMKLPYTNVDGAFLFRKNDLREMFVQFIKSGNLRYVPPEYGNTGYLEKRLIKLIGASPRRIMVNGVRENCLLFQPIEWMRNKLGIPEDNNDLI
jgi:hypothetical protein